MIIDNQYNFHPKSSLWQHEEHPSRRSVLAELSSLLRPGQVLLVDHRAGAREAHRAQLHHLRPGREGRRRIWTLQGRAHRLFWVRQQFHHQVAGWKTVPEEDHFQWSHEDTSPELLQVFSEQVQRVLCEVQVCG